MAYPPIPSRRPVHTNHAHSQRPGVTHQWPLAQRGGERIPRRRHDAGRGSGAGELPIRNLGINGLTGIQRTATGSAGSVSSAGIPHRPQQAALCPVLTFRSRIARSMGSHPRHGRQALQFKIAWNYLGKGYAYQDLTLANNIIQVTIIINASPVVTS